VLGRALDVLPAGGAALIDCAGSVEVELLHGDMWLESRSDEALASGANVALLGGELIQFGAAEALGGGRFRLSRLLRGRRGTEWAALLHQVGEPFALIEREAIALLELSAGTTGREVRVMAQGLGDGAMPPVEAITAQGRALEPASPVHLEERLVGSDVAISWVRRSRSGWAWTEGGDAPLGEEREAYRLRIAAGDAERILVLEEPHFTYTAAAQTADGLLGPLLIEVVQIGTLALSRPASILLS
jgi:hypothetical protein